MRTGSLGTFVVAWSQTEIDGLRSGPVSSIQSGAIWRWTGDAVRVDGPDDILPLTTPTHHDELQARASIAVRRLVGRALPPLKAQNGEAFADPLFSNSFVITDGTASWTATIVEFPELARPLLMFIGRLPPADKELWVAREPRSEGHLNRITDAPTGVICFTPGTLLRTPNGECRVEDLAEGDKIDTKDGGAQEIVWVGRRRMSGARLYAMPELRPVRIRAGALGGRDPREDLVVSPRHKVLLKGSFAQALFNETEVLVAAEDLVNDRTIARDYSLKSVEYVHLLLPRHHVVWANGVETESFHPASTNLETVEPRQRARLSQIVPGIEADPFSYGRTARRELSRSEAAILKHEAPSLQH